MKKIIFVSAFLALICLPYIAQAVLWPWTDHSNNENRTLAEKPVFSLSTLSDFPAQYESYINDHLPFKNELVFANSVIDVKLLHTSTNERVILGKGGWLFLSDGGQFPSIDQYTGRRVLTDEELKTIARNVVKTRDNLRDRGCEFILFIAPDKERVYSENMPDYYGSPAQNYPVGQIVNYINAHTDVKVIYPLETLKAEKARAGDDMDLYYKVDTHWNNLGCYVGTRELLLNLGIEMPPLEEIEDQISVNKLGRGDLSKMLNIAAAIDNGPKYTIESYDKQPGLPDNNATDYIFENPEKEKRAVFLRDSYGESMARYISPAFRRSRVIHWNIFDNKYIAEENPDVFIMESVERRVADRLLSYVYEESIEQIDTSQYVVKSDKDGFKWVIGAQEYGADNDNDAIGYEISGWMIRQGQDATGAEIQILLRSVNTGSFYRIPTRMISRQDVTDHFAKMTSSVIDYNNSGVKAKILKELLDIENDNYDIYALYHSREQETYLIDLNKTIE